MPSRAPSLHFCFLFLLSLPYTSLGSSPRNTPVKCSYFDCGSGINISYPFWNLEGTTGTSEYCGYPGLGLTCYHNAPTLHLTNNNFYYVKTIDRYQSTLTLVDADVVGKNCPRLRYGVTLDADLDYGPDNMILTFFYNCSSYPSSASPIWCLGNGTKRSFVFVEGEIPVFDWNRSCEETVKIPVYSVAVEYLTPSSFWAILQNGFQLRWRSPANCSSCEAAGDYCGYNITSKSFICLCPAGRHANGSCYTDLNESSKFPSNIAKLIIFLVTLLIGGTILISMVSYCIYKKKKLFSSQSTILFWKNKTRNSQNVEVLLIEIYGSIRLKRYKYSDVKKITNSFKDKLGQGGYGAVFKGKLIDGRIVAVKLLSESKGNGEEFLNEVATIGRTNHVNIVCLLGFCYEGSKRALIFEFMSNGSLEKFIYAEKPCMDITHPLGWEKLYQIALGIARGLEYLHRGCSTRILHFDIKPHNILLDQDFGPKISDFGLAKLCPTKESEVSMLGARGTAGYIAPEVYFRNLGGISYKSDVYSYGMMVLEMVGGRKNNDDRVENNSEIFFPNWIYKQLEQQNDIGLRNIEGVADEEKARKMILVGLWCIQINPILRPSMNKVVEMLEGSMEDLQMPPMAPFLDFASNSSSKACLPGTNCVIASQ